MCKVHKAAMYHKK